ncbi:hypothetical protein HMI54_001420 [Coelomomyces lativittatus]|nr:hypothetical protein HMI55_000681 [Coelomomyces lativittatus]KAJ1510333.1 hypothetical protein HMI56_006389 [Coelomomyces lativittatus]KAJ1510676.1 hypothetical protein HMI54_001420 [Coelomomyces lativittatus]
MKTLIATMISFLYIMIRVGEALKNGVTPNFKAELQKYAYAIVLSKEMVLIMNCSKICSEIGYTSCIKPYFSLKETGVKLEWPEYGNAVTLVRTSAEMGIVDIQRNPSSCFCQRSFKEKLTYWDPFRELFDELEKLRLKVYSLSNRINKTLYNDNFQVLAMNLNVSRWNEIFLKFSQSQHKFGLLIDGLKKRKTFEVKYLYECFKMFEVENRKTLLELSKLRRVSMKEATLKRNLFRSQLKKIYTPFLNSIFINKIFYAVNILEESITEQEEIEDQSWKLINSDFWDFHTRLFSIRFLQIKKNSSSEHFCFEGYVDINEKNLKNT